MHAMKLAVLLCVMAFSCTAQNLQITKENKSIVVNASDEASAVADQAEVSIGFQCYGADAKSVAIDGGHISQSIITALHQYGIKDEQISSNEQEIDANTVFPHNMTASEIAARQFKLTQSWHVQVLASDAAELLRVAVSQGANHSGQIEWQYSQTKLLQAQAATNALAKARVIAAQMAEGMHVRLGALIYASNQAPTAEGDQLLAPSRIFGVKGKDVVMPPPPPVPVPALVVRPQKIKETATVYAVFAIE